MVHRHLPSPDSHRLDWQPFWAAERRERRQRYSPVRETTGALTRRVIRRRASKPPTAFHFVSFVGSCEIECHLQVDGNGIANRCRFRSKRPATPRSSPWTSRQRDKG